MDLGARRAAVGVRRPDHPLELRRHPGAATRGLSRGLAERGRGRRRREEHPRGGALEGSRARAPARRLRRDTRDAFLDAWEQEGARHEWSEERFALEVESGACACAPSRARRRSSRSAFRWIATGDGGRIHPELGARAAGHARGRTQPRPPRARGRRSLGRGERRSRRSTALGARAEHAGVTSLGFVDAWAGRRLDVTLDRPAELARAPIETVSLSRPAPKACSRASRRACASRCRSCPIILGR